MSENARLADSFRAAFARWKPPPVPNTLNDKSGSPVKAQDLPSRVEKAPVSEELGEEKEDLKVEDEPAKPCSSSPVDKTTEELESQKGDLKVEDELAKPCLPLSTHNISKNLAEAQEKERKYIISKSDSTFLLTASDLHDIAFRERMAAWVENANHELNKEAAEDLAEDLSSVHSCGLRLRALSMAESLFDDDLGKGRTSATELNPYLAERSQRAKAAEERVVSLIHKRNSKCIKPGTNLYLRHATKEDAEGLMDIYNSYVRVTVECLDTEPIIAEDMRQRIDESRNLELPFIVAICEEPSRGCWQQVLGFVRLTNFLDGQPSVSTAARLEIMVSQSQKGQKIGRCLMDAMLTFADPNYSSRGGYYFVVKPEESATESGSVSCRPLSHLIMVMSHDESDVPRYQRIRSWLANEHKFREQGYLLSVAQKLGQRVNIAQLVRVIEKSAKKEKKDTQFSEWV